MKLGYEIRDDYLYIRVTGVFEFRAAKRSIVEGFQRCINEGMHKVLVDLTDLEGENPMASRYFYMEALGDVHKNYQKAGFTEMSLVYVGSEKFISEDGTEEEMGRSRGLNIKMVSSMDEALAWLAEN